MTQIKAKLPTQSGETSALRSAHQRLAQMLICADAHSEPLARLFRTSAYQVKSS
jgi:hypothetical protein